MTQGHITHRGLLLEGVLGSAPRLRASPEGAVPGCCCLTESCHSGCTAAVPQQCQDECAELQRNNKKKRVFWFPSAWFPEEKRFMQSHFPVPETAGTSSLVILYLTRQSE